MDVSCRTTSQLFEAAEAEGVPRARLTEGLPTSLSFLEDPRNRVPWSVLALVLERLADELGHDPARIRNVGSHLVHVPSYDFLRKLARTAISLRSLYELGNRWLSPAMFPHLHLTEEFVSSRVVIFRGEIPELYAPSAPFFHVFEGCMREIPALFGLPQATIDHSYVTPRKVVTQVVLPRSQTLLARAREVFSAGMLPEEAVELLERQRLEIVEGFGALHRTSGEFQDLLQHLPDLVVIQRGGMILWVNRAIVETLGYDGPDELLGRPMLDIVHPEARERVGERMRQPTDAGPRLVESTLVRKDGEPVTIEVAPARSVTFSGAPARLVVGRDVSERVKMQQRLVTADRMASLGMLAAGVAHEINNPLAYVLGSIEVATRELRRQESPPQGALDALATALDGLSRVRTIVSDLRKLSRPDTSTLEAVDVSVVIESTLALAAREIAARGQVVRELRPTPLALGSAARLGQVLLNLIVNALEAMPEGREQENTLTLRTGTDDHGRVIIEVADNGGGISAETRARIFEPFFTTKDGRGTGLGLAISHQLVSELGGEIDVSSSPGRGTTFRVALAPAGPRVSSVPPPPRSSAPTSARVLVVDDEPMLLESVRWTLSMHDVVLAQSAADAQAILAHDRAFDVVLCDVMMPGRGGVELFGDLSASDPELCPRFVFMTGGALTQGARDFMARTKRPCLDKPFDAEALLRVVDDVVQSNRASHPSPRERGG